MEENAITEIVINRAIYIHRKLGPGLFESVYEEILALELRKAGLKVERQEPVPVCWNDELYIDRAFRADLMVEGKVIIEIKSIEAIAPVHRKQLLTYLRLTGVKLGLLLNFNTPMMKDGIIRIVNNL